MNGRTTIEQAFALARAGECRTLEQLKQRLRKEGFDAVEEHLSGALTKRELRILMQGAGAGGVLPPPPDGTETPAP